MAGPQNFQQYNGFKVYFGSEPTKGPRVLPILFDFTLATTYPVDLLIAQTTDELEFIQSVFIDNSSNSAPLFFTVTGDTQQTIRVPAFVQGYFPVMMNNPPRFTVSCANGGANTLVMLQSFPIPQADWGDASMAFQDASNFFNTVLANGTVANGLFSSGTVTNPGTGQVLIGPIDTMGASSFDFSTAFTSGSGAILSVQESYSTSGPWTTIPVFSNASSAALTSAVTISGTQTFVGPCRARYLEVVCTNSPVTVFSISGYLRSSQFAPTLTTPLTNAIVRTALGSSAFSNTAPANMTSSGYLIEVPYSIPETTWQYSTAGTPITSATTIQLNAGGAAGVRNYIDGIQLYNTGAAGTEIQILDGATVIWDGFLGAAVAGNPGKIEIGQLGIPLRGSAATAISLKTVSGTTISITGGIQGYQAF